MELIGQERIAQRLKTFLPTWYREQTGLNLLFIGPSGYGKTNFALRVAYFLANGKNFTYNVLDGSENVESIFYSKSRIHVFDEIHFMPAIEILYPHMDLRSEVLIFCSNISGTLPEAFFNRCTIFHFEEYTVNDLHDMAESRLEFVLEEEKIFRMIEASGRNPRILLDNFVSDINTIYRSQPELLDDFDDLLHNLYGINENNLTGECVSYLAMLESLGGRSSLGRLSALLHLDPRYLETNIEPILLAKRLIKIGARGREKV